MSLTSPRTPRTTYIRTASSAAGSSTVCPVVEDLTSSHETRLVPEDAPSPAPKAAEVVHNSRSMEGKAEHSVTGSSGDSAGGSHTVCRPAGQVPREGAHPQQLHFRASKLRPADTKVAAEVPRDSDSPSPHLVRKPLLWKLFSRPELDQGQAAGSHPPQAHAKSSGVALNPSPLHSPQPSSDVFPRMTQNNPEPGSDRGFSGAQGRPNKRFCPHLRLPCPCLSLFQVPPFYQPPLCTPSCHVLVCPQLVNSAFWAPEFRTRSLSVRAWHWHARRTLPVHTIYVRATSCN